MAEAGAQDGGSEAEVAEGAESAESAQRLRYTLHGAFGQAVARRHEAVLLFAAEEAKGPLAAGTRVELTGLAKNPELNGQAGEVKGWKPTERRVIVELDGAKRIAVRPQTMANPGQFVCKIFKSFNCQFWWFAHRCATNASESRPVRAALVDSPASTLPPARSLRRSAEQQWRRRELCHR